MMRSPLVCAGWCSCGNAAAPCATGMSATPGGACLRRHARLACCVCCSSSCANARLARRPAGLRCVQAQQLHSTTSSEARAGHCMLPLLGRPSHRSLLVCQSQRSRLVFTASEPMGKTPVPYWAEGKKPSGPRALRCAAHLCTRPRTRLPAQRGNTIE